MDRETFQAWLAETDGLSARQREEAVLVLAEPASLASVLALLEGRIDETRRCPHCAVEGAVIRGRSNGLKRYQCKGCGKTFNALTGTPLARLRKKELWAAFAAGLGEGDTVKGAAARCGVADSTSFRWRHRFLAAVKTGSIKLKGIVEADETYVLTSRKGARKLDRKPRKRSGVAKKRGLSKEQVPIMVVADRGGTTVTAVLLDTTALTIRGHLETAIEPDALLVTDGAPFFPPCARALDGPDAGDLEAAQERKYRTLAEGIGLAPDQRVLEVGCGWGGFAEFVARSYGVRVTALTISREQHDYASRRIFDAGLAERVEIKLQDYREATGLYDRIASIEMIEAVGEAHWPRYFEQLRP